MSDALPCVDWAKHQEKGTTMSAGGDKGDSAGGRSGVAGPQATVEHQAASLARRFGWSAWWLGTLALVMAVQPVAPGAVASAEERFHFGAMELTLAAGGSFSHDTVGENVDSVDGFQALPHFGVFLSDEHGPGWVRGNFELLVEPTLVHFTSGPESATAVGLSSLGRWVFGAGWVVRPYLEFGLGILAGQFDFRQTNCDVNFIIEGGPGLLWMVSDRVAVTAGYRFQHISNASRCDQNLGINSSLFMLGLSYFFP